jgi:iron complex transport system ATP-binding protein
MFELRNLVIGYGKKTETESWTCELSPTPICFIFGGNGSGKTTLLKTLAGILPPVSGEVLFEDKALTSTSTLSERPAYLPTHTELGEHLTGDEILDISGFHKSDWCKDSILEALQLTHMLKRPAVKLSSGELKRLMIASVLAHPSRVVLLDEPLNSLDWNFEFQLGSVIQDQIERGRRFVVCNHDFNWALRFKMSHCWVLQGFCRILSGPTDSILIHEKFQSSFHFRTQLTDNPIDGTKLLALAPEKKQ